MAWGRKARLDAPLHAGEHNQYDHITRKLVLLTTKLTVDKRYQLQVTQKEKSKSGGPRVAALAKARQRRTTWLARFERRQTSCRRFGRCLGGLLVVSDSSLGNAMLGGTSLLPDPVSQKVSTQAGYLLLWASASLLLGAVGQFSLTEGRFHKLKRLCGGGHCDRRRPGRGARRQGPDLRGYLREDREGSRDEVQRIEGGEAIMRPNTQVRWADGENILSDVLAKDIPSDRLTEDLVGKTWAIEPQPEFVSSSAPGGARFLGEEAEGALRDARFWGARRLSKATPSHRQ